MSAETVSHRFRYFFVNALLGGIVMKKIMIVFLLACAGAGFWYAGHTVSSKETAQTHQVLSQSSVLAKIRELNRLESTAFYIDTIIRTEKQGNWYALWQDSEKGMFVAKGNAVAGIDLDKLDEGAVSVVDGRVIVQLPQAEILSVQLDHLEVYDWRTGAFNLLKADTGVLETVQVQAKAQLVRQACANGILEQARERAAAQVARLFELANVPVSVYPAAGGHCRYPA